VRRDRSERRSGYGIRERVAERVGGESLRQHGKMVRALHRSLARGAGFWQFLSQSRVASKTLERKGLCRRKREQERGCLSRRRETALLRTSLGGQSARRGSVQGTGRSLAADQERWQALEASRHRKDGKWSCKEQREQQARSCQVWPEDSWEKTV